MLKIYKTYLQYQTDGSGWEQFGYSGWLCEEENDVEASKSIIENANFKQAFEHFENSPIHCPTGVQPSNYIWLCLFGRFDSQVVCWRRYCWRHEFDFQHNEIYAGYYSAGLRHSCNYW